ncbi:MAG: PEP-CTERM sorting domain-containing protein [Armatimonadota bacterium]|nr:PEP-CTERM sorting domain-containing protein [Armatimonadota bacterium]
MNKAILPVMATVLWASSGATTIFDNFPQWDGNITDGWFGQAQSMTTPAVDNILMEWRFEMAAGNTVGQVGGSVQTMAGNVPSGVVLWSDTAVVPGQGGVIIFNNIGLSLTSGQAYAFVVDFLGYSGETIHFSTNNSMQGDGIWFNGPWFNFGPDLDQKIYARYEAVPEPATLVGFGAGLLLLGIRKLRR